MLKISSIKKSWVCRGPLLRYYWWSLKTGLTVNPSTDYIIHGLQPMRGGFTDSNGSTDYTTDVPFSVEYKPWNIAVNIQWVLTGNYSCHNMSIPNIWCDLWYKSKTTWLMDKNAISHLVDMAKGCHSAYGLVTSLCHMHRVGYCVFLHQPCGLAVFIRFYRLTMSSQCFWLARANIEVHMYSRRQDL